MKRRIIGFFGLMIPVLYAFAFALFSEQIKRWIQDGYNIRYYAKPDKRTQLVALYNAGDVTIPKIRVQQNLQSNGSKSLADFDFASSSVDLKKSFFQTFDTSQALSNVPAEYRHKIIELLDEHSDRQTLYDLDEVLNGILATRMQSVPTLTKAFSDFQKTGGRHIDWHIVWLRKCRGNTNARDRSACQQVEPLLGSWEYLRRELQLQARKEWQNQTGVEVTAPAGLLGVAGPLYFDLPLRGQDVTYLNIYFGPDQLTFDKPMILPGGKEQVTEVDDVSHLRASSFWIYYKYHTLQLYLLITGFVIVVWFAYQLKRPISLLPIHKIFNIALETTEHESWTIGLERYRYFALEEFRYFRQVFGKPNLEYSSEEILDFLRHKLADKYKANRRKYESEQQLNTFVRNQLRFYVLLA